ncbi:hypothetical protein [Maridesulfovibrio sp.]|uniref:hypothetical protein n=1 Tax=Maridesulfovibrio sp. TaxID=2795000 RepID=UPI0029F4F794|nr:hypothetical protein [Maridesulfovibrio sp.]
MKFSYQIRYFVVAVFFAVLLGAALPAHAVKVQIFKAADPQKEVPQRVLREQAVKDAFAQALFSEASRMIPGTLSAARAEVVKNSFGDHYEEYISGYKDMNVQLTEDGASVAIDVNVNRQTLRGLLKKLGLFSSGEVLARISVDNGKYALNEELQLEQNSEIENLSTLYGVSNAPESVVDNVVLFSARHASKNRWSGELQSPRGKWLASGSSMENVWSELWGKYFGSENIEAFTNPKAVLVVRGWFNPEGVREFGRKLKEWDSAVQEVQLLDVEMQPTAVSASWSLEISDQWVLRGYLNDYLPPRGLTFSLDGLGEVKE